MSTNVATHTHNITYVTDGLKSSLLQIVNLIGLDRTNLLTTWESTETAIKTWLSSGHLTKVILEIYEPTNDTVAAFRVDMEIDYDSDLYFGDLGRWKNKEAIACAMAKFLFAGKTLRYRVLLSTKSGEPHVAGWSSTPLKSIANLKQSHFGATIGSASLNVNTSVWG